MFCHINTVVRKSYTQKPNSSLRTKKCEYHYDDNVGMLYSPQLTKEILHYIMGSIQPIPVDKSYVLQSGLKDITDNYTLLKGWESITDDETTETIVAIPEKSFFLFILAW